MLHPWWYQGKSGGSITAPSKGSETLWWSVGQRLSVLTCFSPCPWLFASIFSQGSGGRILLSPPNEFNWNSILIIAQLKINSSELILALYKLYTNYTNFKRETHICGLGSHLSSLMSCIFRTHIGWTLVKGILEKKAFYTKIVAQPRMEISDVTAYCEHISVQNFYR